MAFGAFATNPHGVSVTPINFDAPGAPDTKTYHGFTVIVNGNVVGRINTYTPDGVFARDGNHVKELSRFTFGRPVDYVPATQTGLTLGITRAEVWNKELELAFGFPTVWADLIDQNRPFQLEEHWFRGIANYRVWAYKGCWFQNRNEDGYDSGGDAIVKLSGTIAYVTRVRVA